MSNSAPFEIIAAPYDVYLAPVGTSFPDVSQAPAVAWVLLGASGNKNYDDDGVTVKHEQNIEEFTPVGLTAPRKAFRTEEGLAISFNVVDVSQAVYSQVLNAAAITTVAGGVMIGAAKKINLLQGPDVALFAMLARNTGYSPAGAFNAQYEVPICYAAEEPEVVYKKGEPASLACEWRALWDATLGFGKYNTQTGPTVP